MSRLANIVMATAKVLVMILSFPLVVYRQFKYSRSYDKMLRERYLQGKVRFDSPDSSSSLTFKKEVYNGKKSYQKQQSG